MTLDSKKEENVHTYLRKFFMEYHSSCQNENNGNACHLLGNYTESINKDIKKAAEIFKINCDERNWPSSCLKFGQYKALGKGCDENVVEAFKYFRKGCELKDEKCCLLAAAVTMFKDVIIQENKTKQIKMGMELLEKSCNEYGMDASCIFLADIYMGSLKEYIEPNYPEAYKLNFRSCIQGNIQACATLTEMHTNGEGAQKNEKLSEIFKKRTELLINELLEIQIQLKNLKKKSKS